MTSEGEKVLAPGRYTPPILRSSKPEVLPSNQIERQRVQEEIARMRLEDPGFTWHDDDDDTSPPTISLDDIVRGRDTRDCAPDDERQSVSSLGSGRMSSCHSLKKVSFRGDGDLEQVREIPCRTMVEDSDSDTDTEIKPKTRVVPRTAKRQLSPQYRVTGAFPVRRPKSGPPSKSSEVMNRLKTVKSAPPNNQNRQRSQKQGKFNHTDRNTKAGLKTGKTNIDKQVPSLLSPLLHINSKTIISRKRTHKNTADNVHGQRSTNDRGEMDSHTNLSSPAFSKCNMTSDLDEDSYLASQRMNAWHIANTCDFSQMHKPDIVPLWE